MYYEHYKEGTDGGGLGKGESANDDMPVMTADYQAKGWMLID